MDLKEQLKAEAYRLGFTIAGVCLPEQPPHIAEFEKWIEQGRHGEMNYLARADAIEKRRKPTLVLDGCRSIFVVGMNYPAPAEMTDSSAKAYGRVASYAGASDYHHILVNRLDQLVSRLQTLTGTEIQHRSYSDTGPILERELAMQAGVGWIGKNSCLIDPHKGSYHFLGEVFLDLELEPDVPFRQDRCGTCTRCIQACPTGCIQTDRTIDARRCISYLTIEQRGVIPLELRPQIGNWIFGCDVCQMVCPWNRFSQDRIIDPVFVGQRSATFLDLAQMLSLTADAFERKFKTSPISRPRYRGFLRNVCIAAGNSANPELIPHLKMRLEERNDAFVRRHAAWAIGRMPGNNGRMLLEKALKVEGVSDVKQEIQLALEGSGS